MLTREEVKRYEHTLSKQKSSKSRLKCKKCKTILNYLVLQVDTRTISQMDWDEGIEQYIYRVPVGSTQELKRIHQCPECGAKVKVKNA